MLHARTNCYYLNISFLLILLYHCNLHTFTTMTIIDDPMHVDWVEPPQHYSHPRILQRWNDPLPPREHDAIVRCIVLSDTHGHHDKLPVLPQGDVLIHLGDAANRGSLSDIRSFVVYLKKQQEAFQDIVLVEGNHDVNSQINLTREYAGVGHFVQDQVVTVANGRLSILGVSWSACDKDDYTAALERASTGVDFFLSHKNSKRLSQIVQGKQFPVHLFGHIHRERGVQVTTAQNGQFAVVANCATMPAMRPTVIDWDPRTKQVVLVHAPTSPL